jgi:hypothetical protein
MARFMSLSVKSNILLQVSIGTTITFGTIVSFVIILVALVR